MVGTRSRKTRTTGSGAAAAEAKDKALAKPKVGAAAAKTAGSQQDDTPASDQVESQAVSENSEGVTEEQVCGGQYMKHSFPLRCMAEFSVASLGRMVDPGFAQREARGNSIFKWRSRDTTDSTPSGIRCLTHQ